MSIDLYDLDDLSDPGYEDEYPICDDGLCGNCEECIADDYASLMEIESRSTDDYDYNEYG